MKKSRISFVLVLSVALLLLTSPHSVMAQAWTNLGLNGGRVYDIAIDPSNPDKIFASTYLGDGLFISLDGGDSWQTVHGRELIPGEDEFKNHLVSAVEIAPGNSQIIWVAHNYWAEVSTDGGATWAHIRNSTMQWYSANSGGSWADGYRLVVSLAIDPLDSETVYAGAGGALATYASGTIYRTTDGGATWTKLNQGVEFDSPVIDLTIDPSNTDIIWAVTYKALYRSDNKGDTWNEIFQISTGNFSNVEIKPDDSNSIFTACDSGIFRHYYDNNDTTWKYEDIMQNNAGQTVWLQNVKALAFDPQDPDILYASATKGTIPSNPSPTIARGTSPYGESQWEFFDNEKPLLTLAVHPSNSEVIYGGNEVGAYRTQNHGQAWTQINEGINAIVVYDVAVDPNDNTHILTGTIVGVYEKKGTNGWELISDFASPTVNSIKFHPTNSLIYYAGTMAQMAKTIDGGINWTFSQALDDPDDPDDNTNNFISDIAIDTTNTDIIYISIDGYGSFGKIYKSTNGGNTFNNVLGGINQSDEKYAFNVVKIDPSDNQHLFAGGGNFFAPMILGDLWESIDGGNNWSRTSLQNEIINDLIFDPRDSSIIYTGAGYSGGTEVPLYKSTDGGVTWDPSYKGIPDAAIGLYSVWGSSPSDIFAVGFMGNIMHYDGTSVSYMNSNTTEYLYGVWGSSGTDVFAIGNNGTIIHYDGTNWSSMLSNTTEYLDGVWGSSGSDVFAVGGGGTILHYDGNAWSVMDSGTTQYLYNIWGGSGTDVFAVGSGNGMILHYDGTTWSTMDTGTTEPIYDVWGSSGSDVYVTTDSSGTILHYDGNEWHPITNEIVDNHPHWDIWGSSSSDIFFAGQGDGSDRFILHYNGATWSESKLGTAAIRDIWGSSRSDVFAVNAEGSIFHYDGRSWSYIRHGASWNSVTSLAFHPVNKDVVYAATSDAGIYISPNQGSNWLDLEAPEHSVYAITTGSLYAATRGGILQCTGTGLIAGTVIDSDTQIGINGATLFSDFGVITLSVNGEYMMVSPSGQCSITAIADDHANMTVGNVVLSGGDVTWVNMEMQPGVSEQSGPGNNNTVSSGGSNGGCFIGTLINN